jgi:protein involved in polysaccharide export with SLBB domain
VGEYPLTGSDNVVQILARAGGLTEFAKVDRIFVIREAPKAVRIRFNYEELTQGLGRGLSFRLRDGDVLLVQ